MNHLDAEFFNLLPYFLSKVMVATICGALIGIDREIKQKIAGIRTFILICVGCCILTAVSCVLCAGTEFDPTRMIGQIITGIGFLGAGVIFKTDDKVIGVTTSAFIWVISAIGILAGVGYVLTPIALTFGLLIISIVFEKIETYIKTKTKK